MIAANFRNFDIYFVYKLENYVILMNCSIDSKFLKFMVNPFFNVI